MSHTCYASILTPELHPQSMATTEAGFPPMLPVCSSSHLLKNLEVRNNSFLVETTFQLHCALGTVYELLWNFNQYWILISERKCVVKLEAQTLSKAHQISLNFLFVGALELIDFFTEINLVFSKFNNISLEKMKDDLSYVQRTERLTQSSQFPAVMKYPRPTALSICCCVAEDSIHNRHIALQWKLHEIRFGFICFQTL